MNRDDLHLGAVEMRFAEIVWQHAPLSSGELVKLCDKHLTWKKSTTYTVLKKMCDRGLFQNIDGVVSPLITKAEYEALRSEKFIDETFKGSLPAFLAAFTTRKNLTEAEIAEIQTIIDRYGK